MGFEIVITDEALADLDSITGFLKRTAGLNPARKWFSSIIGAIETLADLPSRCPIATDLDDLGDEVRLLLHGPKNRAYKVYFKILLEECTASGGTVFVFHVRHWARKPPTNEELDELTDDLQSQGDGEPHP